MSSSGGLIPNQEKKNYPDEASTYKLLHRWFEGFFRRH